MLPQQGTVDMDEVFHQTVLDVIKRFSPDKKTVSVPADCLQELKEVVRKNVLHSPRSFLNNAAAHEIPYYQTMARRGSSDQPGEDDESRTSCDSSEESRSNDDDSRSSCSRRVTKSTTNPLYEINRSHKKMSRAKRAQEMRAYRRKKALCEEFDKIECEEEEFPARYSQWYQKLLDSGNDSVFIYQKIMNTIRRFFATKTFESNVPNLVHEFLRNHAVQACTDINEYYDTEERGYGDKEMDRRLLEIQVHAMLEAHLISIDEDKDVKDIIRKMRFIYIASDVGKMKSFLEESLSDQFNHVIPKEMALVFDELCIPLPADIEEFDPNAGNHLPDEVINPCLRKLRARDDTVRQLKEMLEEAAVSDGSSNGKENKKAKARSERKQLPAAAMPPPESPVATRRREAARMKVVLETPEDKMQKMDEEPEVFDEVVKQTPMAKLRQHRKSSARLSELVRISEERRRPARAAAVASEKASRAIISAQVAPNATKEVLFGTPSPSPRPQRTARANLLDRFSDTPSSSRRVKVERDPSLQDDVILSPEKKRLRSSFGSPPLEEIPGLGSEHVSMYKRRMSDITKMKSAPVASPGHARPTRTSLFDDADSSKPKVDQGSIQKNRTGRAVRSGTTVHLG